MADREMIDRVARVLSPTSWQALNTKCDTKTKAKRRKASLDYAKRCIIAMREPTEKMIDEGGYTPSYHDGMIMDETAKMCYQAMIDAILND